MSTRCVIVKPVHGGGTVYWGETGIGLTWLVSPDGAWVYDTKTQAQRVIRACKLGRQKAKVVELGQEGDGS